MTESTADLYRRLTPLCVCSKDRCADEDCPACSQLDPEWPCIMDVGPEGEQ